MAGPGPVAPRSVLAVLRRLACVARATARHRSSTVTRVTVRTSVAASSASCGTESLSHTTFRPPTKAVAYERARKDEELLGLAECQACMISEGQISDLHVSLTATTISPLRRQPDAGRSRTGAADVQTVARGRGGRRAAAYGAARAPGGGIVAR